MGILFYYICVIVVGKSFVNSGSADVCAEGQSSETGMAPGCTEMIESLVFDIHWYINNDLVVVNMNIAQGKLVDAYLRPHHWTTTYSMNMQVKCSVRARLGRNETPSPFFESEEITAGVIADLDMNSFVEVTEGETVTIKLRSTVPVGCLSKTSQSQCYHTMHIRQISYNNNSNKCINNLQTGDLAFETEFCGITIPSIGWNISGAWNRVDIPDIKVRITDADHKLSGRACLAFTLSNFVTIYGDEYSFQGAGEYVLYRHKTLPYSVHILQTAIKSSSTGICGIAVRSDESNVPVEGIVVFAEFRIIKVMLPLSNVFRSDLYVRIIFNNVHFDSLNSDISPSGTEITFQYERYWIKSILVKPSVVDDGRVDGLCGNTANKESISTSWRVSDALQQLFIEKPQNQTALRPPQQYCTLNEFIIDECTRNRRSFMNREKLDDIKEVFPLTYDSSFDPNYIPQEPSWPEMWSKYQAQLFCENYTSSMEIVRLCQQYSSFNVDTFTQGCMKDIKLWGNTNYVEWIVGVIKDYCFVELSRNETSMSRTTENGRTLYAELLNAFCPTGCRHWGNCVNGKCIACDSYNFIGQDCLELKPEPPKDIVLPANGLCDTRHRLCLKTNIYGEFKPAPAKFYCKLDEFKITVNGMKQNGNSVIWPGKYNSAHSISCQIPGQPGDRPTTDLAKQYEECMSTTLKPFITRTTKKYKRPRNNNPYEESISAYMGIIVLILFLGVCLLTIVVTWKCISCQARLKRKKSNIETTANNDNLNNENMIYHVYPDEEVYAEAECPPPYSSRNYSLFSQTGTLDFE
ncbi:unnamed protein product [Mytilus edulis]|uniref:Vwde helical domain-containing protein n=1 Tax=Mytilus edulis TaxID=6550 RepID=A0A8S3TKA4_MYTED|nr:unnamed protein product [Mytilus edulis]